MHKKATDYIMPYFWQFVNNETQEISLKNLFFSLYYFYSCLIALLYRPIIRPIIDLLLVPIAKA